MCSEFGLAMQDRLGSQTQGDMQFNHGSSPKYFCVDGTIGAGKTSILKDLQSHLDNVLIIPEPLDEYRTFQQYDPLEQSQKCEQNAVVTQLHVLRESQEYYSQAMRPELLEGKRAVLSERSVPSTFCFINASHEEGIFTDYTFAYLKNEVQRTNKHCIKPDCYIYLKTPIDVAMSRIASRKRVFEKGITEHYMLNLDRAYESFMRCRDCPVVTFNTEGKTIQRLSIEVAEFIKDTISQQKPLKHVGQLYNKLFM
jgi:deoxyguanosine kinase